MEIAQRTRRLWWIAIVTGVVGAGLGLLWVTSPGGPGFDWIWLIAVFGAGVIVYNLAFFALCSMLTPGLSDLVEDDTEVKGDNVTHVVRHAETGDETADFFIRAYATARGVSVSAIGAAVMIAVALWFF
ncbi:MAG: hypothetical protein JXQ99_25010 [Hyphomicrobiaceae bacterium]